MALYRIAQSVAAAAAGGGILMDVMSPAGGKARVTEWGAFVSSAVQARLALKILSSYSSGRGAATALVPENPSDAALSGITLIDSSAANGGASYTTLSATHAFIELPATVGTGVIWTFPRGLVFSNGSGWATYNSTSGPATIQHVVADI